MRRFLPLFFLIGAWFFFSYPFFLQGKVPYPSTYQVNHFHPWSLDQKYWGPVKNGAMPDIIDQIYPWRHFSLQEWKAGRVPWWNPNSFSGNPHIANVQSAAFSPFNILFLFLPFIGAWSLLILTQPLIAAFGMYLLLRFYKVSILGSLLGSVVWMFSGFLVVWMAYGTLSMAITVLPLLLFCLNNCIASTKLRWGIASSLIVVFSFFSGHFQTSLYLFLVSVGYCLFLFFSEKKKIQSLLSVGFILLGFCLALLQILPAMQFYNLSLRSEIFLYAGGIPFHYLITLIAPDFFGNPVTRNDWFGYYAEWASFVGIIPFAFALFTITRKPRKESVFYQMLLFIALLFSVDSPMQKVLGSLHIPVLSTSAPSRFIVIASFSLAVLSGFGFDRLRELVKTNSLKKILYQLIVLTLLFVGVWGILFSGSFLSPEHGLIAKKNFLLTTLLYITLSALLFIVFIVRKRERLLSSVFLLLVILSSIDSIRFATKWMPFDPRGLVFPNVPVVAVMQEQIGNGRVFGNIGAQVATYYNLPIIEGYDPLYIQRYGEFIRSSATGKFEEAERSVVKVDRNGKYLNRILDLLGVTLIYHPNGDTNQSWAFAVWKDTRFKLIYRDELYSLYRNTTAIPRPALFYSYEVIPDGKKLLQRFYSDEFDFRKTLLLEEDPHMAMSPTSTEKKGKLSVKKITPTDIILEAETNAPAFLFLSDTYYPGWKVRVNGVEAKMYRANYAFRAVAIHEGESNVEFFYDDLL